MTIVYYIFAVCFVNSLAERASEKRFGVCYDPLHDLNSYKEIGVSSVLSRNMELIGQRFASVRTYQSVFDKVDVAPYIAERGLKASIGINTEVDDEFLERQITAAVQSARDSRRYVTMITVGNENLHKGTPSSRLSNIIRRIKALVPGHVKVGTVQRPNEWLSQINGIDELVAVSDIVGVNIYPFFSQIQQSEIQTLNAQWDEIQNRFPGARIVLTETGWPSEGGVNSAGNTANPNQAANYYRKFRNEFFQPGSAGLSLGSDEAFYFQFFDQPYKNVRYEPHFGLVRFNGVRKDSRRLRL